MKRVCLLLLVALSLPGQQGAVVFNNFTATIKGVTIGASHCYFWSQSPAVGHVQTGCYLNGVLQYNAIAYSITQPGVVDSWAFGANPDGTCPANGNCGTITWQFTPGAAPNSINYEMTGVAIPNAGGEQRFTGTF